MNKQHIIDEIKRTAEKNDGRPLGKKMFLRETGIKESDWSGKYWARWGDAVIEAGYEPNTVQQPYGEDWLIEKLILLIRELGQFPTVGERRLKARSDSTFPSSNTFQKLGNKAGATQRVLDYCRGRSGYDDIIEICQAAAAAESRDDEATTVGEAKGKDESEFGFVYLMRSGRYYKIGRSNSAGRREYELSIQLPEKVTTEHVIKTDDPAGIEAYWHRRFKEKRKGGEWFELTANDVKVFKRRGFM